MNSIDLIRMGLKNLWRRKLRTFLTVLGVLIGTSSIIVMLSIGFGMQESYMGMLSRMGDLTTVNVYKYYGGYGDTSSGRGSDEAKLDDAAIATFKNLPHVIAVSPIVETWGMIVSGRNMAYVTLKGIEPESMEHFGYKLEEGRLLEPGDNLSIVFGGGMKYNFYNERDIRRGIYEPPEVDLMNDRMIFTFDTSYGYSDPIYDQQRPRYKEYKLKTAGVLQEGNWDTDYSVFMPIKTVEKMIEEKEKAENGSSQSRGKSKEYERVLVKVDDVNNVQEVQQIIRDSGYDAYSLSDSLEEMQRMSNIIKAVLGGIGAISLLVAAIGITNTMVMSIYERTKEIGIMKVIGASIADIKRLFLFESALIGLLGGVFGVGMSFLLSFVLNQFGSGFLMNMGLEDGARISIIPIWLIFAALGFSALIGILSGYYPARRAMKLSALEAIRTE